MPKIKCSNCLKELSYDSISDIPTFPFCSERCKLIDLGAWFDGEHRIEGPVSDNEDINT